LRELRAPFFLSESPGRRTLLKLVCGRREGSPTRGLQKKETDFPGNLLWMASFLKRRYSPRGALCGAVGPPWAPGSVCGAWAAWGATAHPPAEH